MKNVIKLNHYFCPSELEKAIDGWVKYYNERRFHESLDNLTPRDVYLGQGEKIKKIREIIKQNSINKRIFDNKVTQITKPSPIPRLHTSFKPWNLLNFSTICLTCSKAIKDSTEKNDLLSFNMKLYDMTSFSLGFSYFKTYLCCGKQKFISFERTQGFLFKE